MQRRRFLTTSVLAGVGALSGCAENGNDIQDSDGDGVIDSEDYAPKDPDVQEKADVNDVKSGTKKTETPTLTDTDTPTPSPTPSPTETPTDSPTPSPTPTPHNANSISVNGAEFPQQVSHFTEYGVDSASAWVHPDGPAVSDFDGRELWVYAMGLNSNSVYAAGSTDISRLSNTGGEFSVEMEWEEKPTGESLVYGGLLAPSGKSFSELTGSNTRYFHETDPFDILSDGRTIERAFISEISGAEDVEGDTYSRTMREGEFQLSFSGETEGSRWDVSFSIYKSTYIEARRRDHGRARSEFVAYESASGLAGELAQILSEEAIENGFTGKREQVEFIVDFVQYLPYVPDDVSTGYDDYTKFSAELLVELGGDCEDTSILMAGLLQAEPFNYDMVLIQPPGHMAVGIYGGDDLPGYYWEYEGRKYYYIETTGVGWGIGDLPDVYKNEDAYVIPV